MVEIGREEYIQLRLRRLVVNDDPELFQLVRDCAFSVHRFAETFLHRQLYRMFLKEFQEAYPVNTWPFTQQNCVSLKLLEDDTLPRALQWCWRGYGKSTWSAIKIVHSICYRKWKNYLWIGKSMDKAKEWTDNIKQLLIEEPCIREVFGDFRSSEIKTRLRSKNTDEKFFLLDPRTGERIALITTRASNMPPRGGNDIVDGVLTRYEFINLDDLEDELFIDNETYRTKVSKIFNSSIRYCVDTTQYPDRTTKRWIPDLFNPFWIPPYRFFYSDTMKHPDANIVHLYGDPEWECVKLLQFDIPEGGVRQKAVSLVPEYYSDEYIRSELESAEGRPQGIEGVLMEMGGITEDSTVKRYTQDMFDTHRFHDRDHALKVWCADYMIRLILADPSRSGYDSSDPTGILSVAIDPFNSRYYIRRFINARMHYYEKIDAILRMWEEDNASIIAVEDTGASEDIRQPLETAATQQNLAVQWMWLTAHGAAKDSKWGNNRLAVKRTRASNMLPACKRGEVWFEYGLKNSVFERVHLSFPNCGEWALTDCMGYIPQVCSKLGILFMGASMSETAVDVTKMSPEQRLVHNARKRLQGKNANWRFAKCN